MIKSISNSTLQQYGGTLSKWWLYCNRQKLDLYSVSVGNVISFLHEIFLKNVSYATLNTHKSALALILDISNTDELIIKRFLKGVFRERPSFPRYNETWDPFVVLNLIKKWYPLEELSLEKLVKKLVVLLVLASGQRVQTISKINLKNIKIKEDGVEIYFTDLLKTSKSNRGQPILKFNFFIEQPDLCVAKTLVKYLEVTQNNRNKEDYLILTYRKPVHKASTQSISRWIKDVMKASGIDISIFKSHSTRHASTSAVHRAGMNIDSIKNSAGWTKKSEVFAKFYNRPLVDECNFVEYLISNS